MEREKPSQEHPVFASVVDVIRFYNDLIQEISNMIKESSEYPRLGIKEALINTKAIILHSFIDNLEIYEKDGGEVPICAKDLAIAFRHDVIRAEETGDYRFIEKINTTKNFDGMGNSLLEYTAIECQKELDNGINKIM